MADLALRQQVSKKYAFVLPRFGLGIAGGAETLVGALARNLAKRGEQIEVWTTCAKDHRTWENEFPAGVAVEDGVTVRRFAVDKRNVDTWLRHQIAISQGLKPDVEDQLDWLANGVNSCGLYAHIEKNAPDFDALFFAPYLFSTTFFGALICPEKSILIPCLHDENYAYLEAIGTLFRQVKGAVFNAAPEMKLARELYGNVSGADVGMGFEPWSETELAGLSPYFKEKFPYLLYLGRKETGKSAQQLIDDFIILKESRPQHSALKLVVCGGGDFADLMRPTALSRGDIIDLSHLSEVDKRRLVRHATVLVQPSRNESFSIVLMEAWLLERPVLVSGLCPVTRSHVLDSGGGLYYSSPAEFGSVVEYLLAHPDLARQMGQAGFNYVQEQYNWESVLKRFDQAVQNIFNTCPN